MNHTRSLYNGSPQWLLIAGDTTTPARPTTDLSVEQHAAVRQLVDGRRAGRTRQLESHKVLSATQAVTVTDRLEDVPHGQLLSQTHHHHSTVRNRHSHGATWGRRGKAWGHVPSETWSTDIRLENRFSLKIIFFF